MADLPLQWIALRLSQIGTWCHADRVEVEDRETIGALTKALVASPPNAGPVIVLFMRPVAFEPRGVWLLWVRDLRTVEGALRPYEDVVYFDATGFDPNEAGAVRRLWDLLPEAAFDCLRPAWQDDPDFLVRMAVHQAKAAAHGY